MVCMKQRLHFNAVHFHRTTLPRVLRPASVLLVHRQVVLADTANLLKCYTVYIWIYVWQLIDFHFVSGSVKTESEVCIVNWTHNLSSRKLCNTSPSKNWANELFYRWLHLDCCCMHMVWIMFRRGFLRRIVFPNRTFSIVVLLLLHRRWPVQPQILFVLLTYQKHGLDALSSQFPCL